MSMGVRMGDQALKAKLDSVIERHGAEIGAALSRAGIKSSVTQER